MKNIPHESEQLTKWLFNKKLALIELFRATTEKHKASLEVSYFFKEHNIIHINLNENNIIKKLKFLKFIISYLT